MAAATKTPARRQGCCFMPGSEGTRGEGYSGGRLRCPGTMCAYDHSLPGRRKESMDAPTTIWRCRGVELRVVFAHGGIHALDIPFVRRDRCRYRHVARALRRRGAKPETGSASRAPNRRWQAADGRPEVAPVGPR